MIVFEDGGFSRHSEFPNEDWTKSAKYVIDETTEHGAALAAKMVKNFPYYTLIVDNQGGLVDVELTERPPVPPPAPSQDDYMVDLDYRMCILELGL